MLTCRDPRALCGVSGIECLVGEFSLLFRMVCKCRPPEALEIAEESAHVNHDMLADLTAELHLRLLCEAREKLPESRMGSSWVRRGKPGDGSGGGSSLVNAVIGGSDCGIAEAL